MSFVSREFREAALAALPDLGAKPELFRLLVYLMFPRHLDRISQNVVLDGDTLMRLDGKGDKVDAGKGRGDFKGARLLKRFKRCVMDGFAWSGWDSTKRLARVATKTPWPRKLAGLISAEISRGPSSRELVSVDAGRPCAQIAADRRRERRESHEFTCQAACGLARRLLRYLNTRTARLFTIPPGNFDVARRAIDEEAKVKTLTDTQVRYRIGVLRGIEAQPQPFYQAAGAGRTVRVYGKDVGLLATSSSVRAALMPHWTELDISSSQLRINAADWHCPKLLELLRGGGSFWDQLIGSIPELAEERSRRESAGDDPIKDAVKKAVYGVCYGMTKHDFSAIVRNTIGLNGVSTKLLANPYISELYDARAMREKLIVEKGGFHDAFGRWIAMEGGNVASVLAVVAQSVEMKVLGPVVELAGRSTGPHGFSITLWQHDGFSIVAHRPAMTMVWVDRLKKAVREYGKSLGYDIELEVKQAGVNEGSADQGSWVAATRRLRRSSRGQRTVPKPRRGKGLRARVYHGGGR